MIIPNNPVCFIENNPNNTKVIWATDEYAIRDFKSF